MSEMTVIRDAGSAMPPASGTPGNSGTPGTSGANDLHRRLRALARHAPRHAAYLLLGWIPPLITFVVVVGVGSAGLGTLVLWIGLPLLALTALCARHGATVERTMATWATGVACPAPRRRPIPADASWVRSMLLPFTDPQVWLNLIWAVFGWIVSLIAFVVALTWVVAATSPATAWYEAHTFTHGRSAVQNVTTTLMNLTHCANVLQGAAMGTLAGLFFLVTLPGVLALLAHGRALLTRSVLSNGTLAHENTSLRTSRDAGRLAETTRLRQLERDIHDGPQQRLVRLTMDLARTKQIIGRDPEQAQDMLDAAMLATQQTLAELRNLSRGIAPPVLVDRGLEAALTELAALSGVPVTLHTELPRDLPDHVATAAYFAASEALTNVNKHSGASHAQVICGVQDNWLFLTVTDDGVGGARLDKGHGLAGLADRLRAVDGQLDLDSPEGGGTRLEAVIWCRS